MQLFDDDVPVPSLIIPCRSLCGGGGRSGVGGGGGVARRSLFSAHNIDLKLFRCLLAAFNIRIFHNLQAMFEQDC